MIRLNRNQLREIDRRSLEDYHIPGIVLMENAAIAAADIAWNMRDATKDSPITIVCGGGNNAGDGLAIGRHLANRGAEVLLVLTVAPEKFQGDALINWEIAQAMGLTWWHSEIRNWPLDGPVVDAILGTGLTEPPRPPAARAIKRINASEHTVLAIDVPSGLDCDTGEPLGPCIRATKTITFVAEKAGYANPAAADYLAEIIVAGIGCPQKLIEQVAKTKAKS